MKEARLRNALACAALLSIISAMMSQPAGAQKLDPIIEGHVAVQLRLGLTIAEFNARWGSRETEQSIASRRMYVVDITGVPGDPSEEEFADMVREDTVWAEPDYFGDGPEAFGSGRNFYCSISPDAAAYNNQAAWAQINLGAAHQVSTGGGTIVAILDTGIDASHPALAGRVLENGWNFVNDNGDVSDYFLSGDLEEFSLAGHGTHMAGIIAKVAPDAMILPIKVLDRQGTTNTFMIAQGIFYAIDQGVDVINVSIGSTYDAKAVEDALDEARSRGIVIAAAAGNVGMEDTKVWEFPALNEEVIGVVAVDEEDNRAGFSNINHVFAISAPGVGIFSTLPAGRYGDLDGTSTASPMVAGTAALLISAHPQWPANEWRAGQVELLLSQSALVIDDLETHPDNWACCAGLLGDGRLDAGGALNTSAVFDQPVSYPTGDMPSAVAAADLNGDYVDDLAVVNLAGNSVSVLHNRGDGTFTLIDEYAVGAGPEDVVAADFNNDGRRDLAVARLVQSVIS